MSRYIDADELLKKAIYPFIESDLKVVTVEDIKSAPTADVKPIVYGKWQYERADSYTCSKCGHWYSELFDLEKCTANFCPNCGADMRKESEKE